MDTEGLGAAVDAEPARVFMSYRRADDRHFIGRLHDRLCDAFGDERVFRDIDSIPAGTNFRQVILRTLNEVDAVVAVIGPNWARTSTGDDRADTDYVFLELAEALKQRKPVLPVLMEGTDMPSPDVLPADLRALCDINAISVHGDPAFRRDSMRLIEAIVGVVAEERSRVARERLEAQERARRVEEERAERERLAEQLRAEERDARARLAELEDAATRRQIEQERARLDDIAAKIRQAESGGEPASVSVEPPTEAVQLPATAAPLPTTAAPTTALGAGESEQPWFQILLVAALILGVAGVPLNRSGLIGDSTFQFNELMGDSTVDMLEWLLTLAVAVPLLLGKRPVEQRFVLAGVVVSTLFYEFLQASATVRYGDQYDERSWFLLRIVQIGCLAGAYRIVRQRVGQSSTGSRYRNPLVVAAGLTAIAVVSAILLVAATYGQWSDASTLIDESFVPDRTPLPVWLLLVALGPIAVTILLAARGSYTAHVSLATIATLGVLSYFSEATLMDNFFQLDGSKWRWVALSQLFLAAGASWAVTAGAHRSAE